MNGIIHLISVCIEKTLQTALVAYTVRFYQFLITNDHVNLVWHGQTLCIHLRIIDIIMI